MPSMPEVVIKLGPAEIQQVLSIDLDRDPEQALRFIQEKIVDKCFQPHCKQFARSGSYP
jgi:hypothetical protein